MARMTPITPEPVETLIRHAWDLYEQDSECDHAAHLRQAVWQLEEAVDYGHDDVEARARRVIQALSVATGEEVGDILSPTPSVAAWLESDQ
ncbi:hypothetical protein C5O27_11860 [Gordonia alkanivorans]|nr:hypothetical protein C5O27_11860 [Gordonia alkanivorans]